jgi:hypothetical protein
MHHAYVDIVSTDCINLYMYIYIYIYIYMYAYRYIYVEHHNSIDVYIIKPCRRPEPFLSENGRRIFKLDADWYVFWYEGERIAANLKHEIFQFRYFGPRGKVFAYQRFQFGEDLGPERNKYELHAVATQVFEQQKQILENRQQASYSSRASSNVVRPSVQSGLDVRSMKFSKEAWRVTWYAIHTYAHK